MKMDVITGELVNRAIEIYLKHAYQNAPQAKGRRVPEFPAAKSLRQILSEAHPFEDLTGGTPTSIAANPVPVAGGEAPRVYALRLGNSAYPHMKLAVMEAYFPGEFVFAVDRHDTFHFDPHLPGYDAWCELKEINRIVKEAVEDAWHKAGIPTLRGLREDRFDRPDLVRELRAEGHTLLVLDDDQHRAEILGGILRQAGYDVVIGPPGPPPKPDDTRVIRARKSSKGKSLRLPASVVPDADRVKDLCTLISKHRVALVILDVSYRTGQGPRVADALRMNSSTQEVPILGIYSRRDFGPDPDLFNASLRRPYRSEAILHLVELTLVRRSRGGSGIHKAVGDRD